MAVDPTILRAWLAARSIARGLPAPIADGGGFRIDTGTGSEVGRWVFPQVDARLVELGRTLAPGHLLKLCGTPDELRSALPGRWRVHPRAWFMAAGPEAAAGLVPDPYVLECDRRGPIVAARMWTAAGALAASGFAAETCDAFVYDRIVTAPEHRRRGLAAAVMAALGRARRNRAAPQLLVATESGRALYAALGWRILSPYATASIDEA